ncbi:MAG: MarC family protein [bacterium]|nr:MarC family protein [bacterium]
MSFLEPYLITFIPLFVAVDAIGLLPIYLTLTEGFSLESRMRVLWQSLLTATIVAVAFVLVGRWIFSVLGITVADFKIAGGLILLVLAIMDLLKESTEWRVGKETMGIVPIGVPLIVGPAVLTTVIMFTDIHGLVPTLVSLLLNLAIVGILFYNVDKIISFIGKGGAKAGSKVISLLLAAIAVMMIRQGLQEFIR